jgi:2-polyprenyl-3-methyl-5-hydroxy-6-metoxy-1,4-benzoquinol methylase
MQSTDQLDIGELLTEPQKYKNSGGGDIFGYPPQELWKAAFYYAFYLDQMEFEKAFEIHQQIVLSINIEQIALAFKQDLFKNLSKIPFLKGKTDLWEIIYKLYSRYSNKSIADVKQLFENKVEIHHNLWKENIPDEDKVTPEQLSRFYNAFPFPVGCFFWTCADSNLAIAYSALPLLLAKSNKCKAVFDYGGNSGLITSAMANSLKLDRCMLIEENKNLLDFAKWRDKLFMIEGITYQKESELINNIDSFKNKFDFGICTEVLEHVYDVEATIINISQLLKSGGLLYQSTSFGLPEKSHLHKNRKYAGYEDKLMDHYGFNRITPQFSIPLLSDIRLYVKR